MSDDSERSSIAADQTHDDTTEAATPEQEQRRIALQSLVAGWEDAINKGVDPQTVAITALSTGITGIVDCLGQEGARMVAEKLPEQIAAGYFSPRDRQH